ncbi:MAG: hypothetical protein IKP86_14380 [Anaerolineaceae bacterium]|nr:hypothetical protein [Anaerolineaceae bacterium]
MRRNSLLVVFLMFCLCACGAKSPSVSTVTPTPEPVVQTEIPVTEAAPEVTPEDPENSDLQEADLSGSEAVLAELSRIGEQMESGVAYIVQDDEGNTVWKAPLAGIEEFRVPDYMLDAHGGIRAAGGTEFTPGTGIVFLDVFYYSLTEHEYYESLEKLTEAENDTENIDETYGVSRRYLEIEDTLDRHRYPLFTIFGVGADQDEQTILDAERQELKSYNTFTDEEIEEALGWQTFTKIGEAEDYSFYFVQTGISRKDLELLKEDGAAFRAEYESLYGAMKQIVPNFTFTRPIGVEDKPSGETGL